MAQFQSMDRQSKMTLDELKAQYKSENPELRRGNDVDGYEVIGEDEYEKIIHSWALATLSKEKAKIEAENLRLEKIEIYKKLGLSDAEIEVIIPSPKTGILHREGN